MRISISLGLTGFCLSALSSRWWFHLPSVAVIIASVIIMCILVTALIWTNCSCHKIRIFNFNTAKKNLCINFAFHSVNFITGCTIGFIWMASVWYWLLYWQLPNDKIQQDVIIEGRIIDHKQFEHYNQYLIRVDKTDASEHTFPYKVTVKDYQRLQSFYSNQFVRIKVKLKPELNPINPGGYDARQRALSQGRVFKGYLRSFSGNQVLDHKYDFRSEQISQLIKANPTGLKWLLALTFGDRSAFERDDWLLLQRTGLAHVMSISGMHLSMVAVWTIVVLRLLVLIYCQLFKIQHDFRLVISLVTFIVTGGYVWLAGANVPVVRAWILLSIGLLLFHSHRYWATRHVALVMLTACILLFPYSVLGMSLWLSISAVLVIWLSSWRFKMRIQTLKDKFKTAIFFQLVISLAMLPLIGATFGAVSIVSPLINLLVTPVIEIAVVPLCLLSFILSLLGFDSLFEYTGVLLVKLMHCAKLVSDNHWASIDVQSLPNRFWLLLTLVIGVVFLPKFTGKQLLLSSCCVTLVLHFIAKQDDKWKLHIIDVGHGSAALVTVGNRGVLIDTGASYYRGGTAAQSYIYPTLIKLGVKHIDHIILTHSDNDHAGGTRYLNEQYPRANIINAEQNCINGFNFLWRGLSFSAIWPMSAADKAENNDSCVFFISDGEQRILVTGDIEQEIEQVLLNNEKDLSANVLIAPHHGSKSSSSFTFLTAVSPDWIIYSQGFMHRWGFPHGTVLQRAGELNIRQLLTGYHGYIRFNFEKNKSPQLYTYRQAAFAPWFRRGVVIRDDIKKYAY